MTSLAMEALPHPPHPTQVRSACERCRRQKLRCNRQPLNAASCIRCEELSLDCQVGPPKKVGRPTKKELSRSMRKPDGNAGAARTSGGSNPAHPGMSVEGMGSLSSGIDANQARDQHPLATQNGEAPTLSNMDEISMFVSSLEQGTAQDGIGAENIHNDTSFGSMDWIIGDDSHFILGGEGNDNFDSLPSLESGSGTSPTDQFSASPSQVESTVIRLTTNTHFWTLSKINMELHELWETLSVQPANGTLEGFVCDCNINEKNKLKPYQSLMKLSQDYLVALKTLHKSLAIDSRFVKPRPSIWVPRGCLLSAEAIAAKVAASPACGFTTSDSSPSDTTSGAAGEPPQRIILDSPTALLVISCFSQLVQHLEMFLSISQARLLDSSSPLIPPAEASFAGIAVLEFITQGAMFVELLRCNFAQILVVLGLPTDSWWSGKTLWSGLLAEQRYRDLLNQELGDVQGGWTARPLGVLHSIDSCRRLLNDVMMSGCAG